LRKKLLLLDLVLLALATVVCSRVRDAWLEARKREAVVLGQKLKPAPAPPFAPLPAGPPVTAAAFADIAQKTLFSADRNPTVVIEVVPEKPMPPLPLFHGAMDIGSGTTAFLSEKAGAPPQKVRYGEKIGEFTLVAVSREDIVFTWQGKKVVKKIQDLVDRSEPAQQQAAPPPAQQASNAQSTALGSTASSTAPSLGADVGGGFRACNPADKSPAGTVLDGYKKVISPSPFGSICRWEQVK
jgi:hypothetical protein